MAVSGVCCLAVVVCLSLGKHVAVTVCVVCLLLFNESQRRQVFALGGKCAISTAFAVIYVYAVEVFATSVRNAAMVRSSPR